MDYSTFAKEQNLKEDEVLFFTSQGVDKIIFENIDQYLENMSLFYGEEGKSFSLNMAITLYAVFVGEEQIRNAFKVL